VGTRGARVVFDRGATSHLNQSVSIWLDQLTKVLLLRGSRPIACRPRIKMMPVSKEASFLADTWGLQLLGPTACREFACRAEEAGGAADAVGRYCDPLHLGAEQKALTDALRKLAGGRTPVQVESSGTSAMRWAIEHLRGGWSGTGTVVFAMGSYIGGDRQAVDVSTGKVPRHVVPFPYMLSGSVRDEEQCELEAQCLLRLHQRALEQALLGAPIRVLSFELVLAGDGRALSRSFVLALQLLCKALRAGSRRQDRAAHEALGSPKMAPRSRL
jgi:hypothetical protein